MLIKKQEEINKDNLPTKKCFLCGKDAGVPIMHYDGETARLTLHPKCAKKLSLQLNMDWNHLLNNKTLAEAKYRQALEIAFVGYKGDS